MILFNTGSGLALQRVSGPARPSSEWLTEMGAGVGSLAITEFDFETEWIDVSDSNNVKDKTESALRTSIKENLAQVETTLNYTTQTADLVTYDVSHIVNWDVRLYFADDTHIRWGQISGPGASNEHDLPALFEKYYAGTYLEIDWVTMGSGTFYFVIEEVKHFEFRMEIKIT